MAWLSGLTELNLMDSRFRQCFDVERKNEEGIGTPMASKSSVVPIGRLRSGGREHSAKQKAFGTVLASAPSPAFYQASKNPLSHMGGFFNA